MGFNENARVMQSRAVLTTHPMPQLQGPFEESMRESLDGQEENEIPPVALIRRNKLLESPTYERIIAGRWKQKPGEKYHPLWKLIAQMSFGMHLLAQDMAQSDDDVMEILQSHVDEIDIFIERTTEDFTLALEDVSERLRCLKLPLKHPEVFDRMLEDRTFRGSIVDGNEKIEHIVTRTGCAMKDSLKDVQKGFDASCTLEKYLQQLEFKWQRLTVEHEAVFVAMVGNVEGWKKAFTDLYMQGNKLAGCLRKLTDVVNQMQQRAGEVSRKLISKQQKSHQSTESSNNITYYPSQPNSNRSSSRQQHTPTESSPRKILPDAPSHSSMQKPSRTNLQECVQPTRTSAGQVRYPSGGERPPTHASQRPNGADALRSRSADVRSPVSPRDLEQPKSGLKVPRLVYVKGQQHRNELPDTSVAQQAPDVRQVRSIPVELPSEIPERALRLFSDKNRMSSGFGLLPSARRMQAAQKNYDPASALIELLSDPARFSKLPSTPMSAVSPMENDAQQYFPGQRSSSRNLSTPVSAMSPSPPSTPDWAKTTFAMSERRRMLVERTAVRSHPPEASPGSPPTVHQPLPPLKTQKLDVPKSPNVPASAIQLSASITDFLELSAGYYEREGLNKPDGKSQGKSFVAELEGTTPVLPQQTALDSNTSVVVELEAPPAQFFRLPPRPQPVPSPPPSEPYPASFLSVSSEPAVEDASTAETKEVTSQDSEPEIQLEDAEAQAIQKEVVKAIRRSMGPVDIPLPDTPVDDRQMMSSEGQPQTCATNGKNKAEGRQQMVSLKLDTSEAVNGVGSHTPTGSPIPLQPLSAISWNSARLERKLSIASPTDLARPPMPEAPSTVEEEPVLLLLPKTTYTPPIVRTPATTNSVEDAENSLNWRAFFNGQLPNSAMPPPPATGTSKVGDAIATYNARAAAFDNTPPVNLIRGALSVGSSPSHRRREIEDRGYV